MFGILRNEKGSAMIIFVFALVALLGMTAVAIDTGAVALEKQRLQKAVDAAALAAADSLPDTAAAVSTANRYVTLNGFKPSDITVTFENSNKTVVVKAVKRVDYTFARVLGINSVDVALGAKAARAQMGGAFSYSVFSGSTTTYLAFNGTHYMIGGSTHTNYNFVANGSYNQITGACEAKGTVIVNGGNNHIDTRVPGAAVITMPDFSETIRQQAQSAGQLYVGDKIFNGSSVNLDKPIYVDGNIYINGSNFTGVGFLFATGDIIFNGSSQKVSTGDSICIYTQKGNIYLNGSGAQVDGLLYAPTGNIIMNGSNQTVNGRVIGDVVTVNGSYISITASDEDTACLPSSYVKLVD